MFLDRVQEHLAAGNRPSATAHIKMGANRDGKIVAMIADAHGTGGVGGGGRIVLPYVLQHREHVGEGGRRCGRTSAISGRCGRLAILRAAR